MAFQRYKKGTGITAEDWEVADGEDLRPSLERFFNSWTAARTAGGDSDYGAVSNAAAKLMEAKLSEFGLGPHDRDSEGDFAKRFFNKHDFAKAALDRIEEAHGKDSVEFRNADAAARFAWQAAVVYTMAAMKFAHEADAIRGALSPISGAQGAAVTNAARKVEKEKRYAQIIEVQSDIQSRKPQLSLSALDSATVAALSKKGIKVSIPTVKRARLSAK